ncbi:transaldolase [Candidatus Woesearchaeota archaeon]|nr:transaldolase [Candidatus Woesearchaeota archaeon]
MKIFIDSADIEEIRYAYSGGVIDGVTTNPSLIKKAVERLKTNNDKINMSAYIKQLLIVAKGTPVSLEVTASDFKGMVEQGKKIYKAFNPATRNVVIKIPVNPSLKKGDGKEYDGIKAIKNLTASNIPVNATLIFTPEQALMAAKAGARFVSPFAGRIDDDIRSKRKSKFSKTDYFPMEGITDKKGVTNDNGIVSGIDLVAEIVEIFREQNIKSEVLAASIRNPRQAREAAIVGAHIATLPFDVIKELLDHRKTMEGMIKFTKDIVPEYAKLLE